MKTVTLTLLLEYVFTLLFIRQAQTFKSAEQYSILHWIPDL